MENKRYRLTEQDMRNNKYRLKIGEGNKGNLKRELIYSDKIKCGATPNGYGVYCIKPIAKGEIIEECVVASDRLPPNTNIMRNYRFRGVEISPNIFDEVIILGNAMLYNHSQQPNIDIKDNTAYERLMYVFALRDIQPGEELKWNYGYQPQ